MNSEGISYTLGCSRKYLGKKENDTRERCVICHKGQGATIEYCMNMEPLIKAHGCLKHWYCDLPIPVPIDTDTVQFN